MNTSAAVAEKAVRCLTCRTSNYRASTITSIEALQVKIEAREKQLGVDSESYNKLLEHYSMFPAELSAGSGDWDALSDKELFQVRRALDLLTKA